MRPAPLTICHLRGSGLTENAGHESAGHEFAGHENERHDNYRAMTRKRRQTERSSLESNQATEVQW